MGSNMIIAAESGGSGATSLLLLLAVPLVFYFLLIRPQSKRRKEQMQMQNRMEPGARVITTSGMHATVVAVDDDGLVLEIAPGVEARFVKQAVMQVLKDEVEDDGTDEEIEADGDDEPASGESVDLGKKDAAAGPAAPSTSGLGEEAEGSKVAVKDVAEDDADEAGEAADVPSKGKARAEAAEKPSA